jgi:hypothetical protein
MRSLPAPQSRRTGREQRAGAFTYPLAGARCMRRLAELAELYSVARPGARSLYRPPARGLGLSTPHVTHAWGVCSSGWDGVGAGEVEAGCEDAQTRHGQTIKIPGIAASHASEAGSHPKPRAVPQGTGRPRKASVAPTHEGRSAWSYEPPTTYATQHAQSYVGLRTRLKACGGLYPVQLGESASRRIQRARQGERIRESPQAATDTRSGFVRPAARFDLERRFGEIHQGSVFGFHPGTAHGHSVPRRRQRQFAGVLGLWGRRSRLGGAL